MRTAGKPLARIVRNVRSHGSPNCSTACKAVNSRILSAAHFFANAQQPARFNHLGNMRLVHAQPNAGAVWLFDRLALSHQSLRRALIRQPAAPVVIVGLSKSHQAE
jgi:hypothetical protein